MSKLTVALIGLGKVGQGYDFDSSDDSVILTHATAIEYHPKFELIAGVDVDQNQRNRFEKKFSKPAFNNFQELYLEHNPDVVSIAVPTRMHSLFFQDVISFNPKAIVLEKPVAESVAEAQKMLRIAKANDSVVSVNYLRRFNPALVKLKKKIHEGKFGEIYKGFAWYTKGIIENGSHFVDLFQWLLGESKSVQVMKSGRKWDDHDPEPDVCIRFGEADIYLLSGREENYCMGSFELVGTNGMIHFEDGKSIKMYFAQEDPVYAGYRNIGNEQIIANKEDKNMWYAYDNLANHLESGEILNSTLETGINTLKTVEKIIS